MPDCENLHPPFGGVEDVVCHARWRARPSLVESLAVAAVLFLVLVTNVNRWTRDINAEAPAATIALDENGAASGPDSCRYTSDDC